MWIYILYAKVEEVILGIIYCTLYIICLNKFF